MTSGFISEGLLARLDTLQVPAKLKDIKRRTWKCGKIVRATTSPGEGHIAGLYIAYISLLYDYHIRYVSFMGRGEITPWPRQKHILPAERNEDHLSFYGRSTARYVKGKKRTQLFVAAVETLHDSRRYLEILDQHDSYLSGDYARDESAGSPNRLPGALMPEDRSSSGVVEFSRAAQTVPPTRPNFDGTAAPIIELSDNDQAMGSFLDRWLKEACKRRVGGALPKELEARALATIRAPDRQESFLRQGF